MSPTLVHPRAGKSISIALAFALRACVRACVRAKLRERDGSAVAGGGQIQVPGSGCPAGPGPAACLARYWYISFCCATLNV